MFLLDFRETTLAQYASFPEQQMFGSLIHGSLAFSSSNNVANNDINLLIISNNGQSDEISGFIVFFLGKQTYQDQTSCYGSYSKTNWNNDSWVNNKIVFKINNETNLFKIHVPTLCIHAGFHVVVKTNIFIFHFHILPHYYKIYIFIKGLNYMIVKFHVV